MQEDEVTGRARGGVARAESLSPEQRQEIARRGALARWGAKATHKGNFNDELGIDVDCGNYILDVGRDAAHTDNDRPANGVTPDAEVRRG